ncbi:MAG: hypothetical protein J6Y98_05375 [Bacteroidales bacterium]|nr:hypothetical protein [Bacteroidales bacterium]
MKFKRVLVVCFFSLIAFVGCKSDLYIAGSYLSKFERAKDNATEQIFVKLPASVMHTNSSLNEIAGFMFMSEHEQDSIIQSKTAILDKIDDSIFIAQFSEMFLFVLSRTHIPVVVVPSSSLLPRADSNHIVVDFVQMEAEEYLKPESSGFETRRGSKFSYDYLLRHFSLGVWLRFDNDDSAQVFYKDGGVDDEFHGTVTSLKGDKASMRTSFDRIDVNDAYRLARDMGYQCATLMVERMLVDHVREKKGANDFYFLYNPSYNTIEDVVPYDEGIKWQFEKL